MTVTSMPQSTAEAGKKGKKGKKGDKGDQKKGRRMKLLALAMVVVVAATTWLLVLKPAGAAEPAAGEMLTMQPIQINLAAGRYLKVGVAVQLTDQAEQVDPSLAIDAVIETFSAKSLSDLATPDQRGQLKKKLLDVIKGRYDGQVMQVYYTDFVTQ